VLALVLVLVLVLVPPVMVLTPPLQQQTLNYCHVNHRVYLHFLFVS